MKLDTKKASELVKDQKFVEELSKAQNDKEKFINLFAQHGVELSEDEYTKILSSKEQLKNCSEDELQEIAGGHNFALFSNSNTIVHGYHASPTPMNALTGVLTGSVAMIIGTALTLASLHKWATEGAFSTL